MVHKVTAIHAFMLKHQMILGHRGVSGIAYEKREILTDKRAIRDVKELATAEKIHKNLNDPLED